MSIQPFKISISQATLDDLRERLVRTRWPDEVEEAGWDYGTNLNYLKSLVAYWQHHFDWQAHEAKLNQFAHFKVDLDGLGIHFIHERGKGPNPLPIILTHGWPDSFYRFHKLIPMLTDPASYGGDPADSFDVIAPSLPGFGFSDRPGRPLTLAQTAEVWARLMRDVLGYQLYAAAGETLGAGSRNCWRLPTWSRSSASTSPILASTTCMIGSRISRKPSSAFWGPNGDGSSRRVRMVLHLSESLVSVHNSLLTTS